MPAGAGAAAPADDRCWRVRSPCIRHARSEAKGKHASGGSVHPTEPRAARRRKKASESRGISAGAASANPPGATAWKAGHPACRMHYRRKDDDASACAGRDPAVPGRHRCGSGCWRGASRRTDMQDTGLYRLHPRARRPGRGRGRRQAALVGRKQSAWFSRASMSAWRGGARVKATGKWPPRDPWSRQATERAPVAV